MEIKLNNNTIKYSESALWSSYFMKKLMKKVTLINKVRKKE